MIAQLRKLVLGETWALPLGIAVTLLAGLALDAAGPAWWQRAGGFVAARRRARDARRVAAPALTQAEP